MSTVPNWENQMGSNTVLMMAIHCSIRLSKVESKYPISALILTLPLHLLLGVLTNCLIRLHESFTELYGMDNHVGGTR